MGIFTGSSRIQADKSYGNIGYDESAIGESVMYQVFTENVKNDLLLFESVLEADFNETCAVKLNEASKSTLRSIHEASISDIINKVKDFIVDIARKIAGFIKSAITTIQGKVIRDNEKLVSKFGKSIAAKDLSELKYKWRTNKKDPNTVFNTDILTTLKSVNIKTAEQDISDIGARLAELSEKEPLTIDEILKEYTQIPDTLHSNIKTVIEEKELENYKPIEGMSQARVKGIEEFLLGSGKFIKDLKEIDDKCAESAKSKLKALDSVKKEIDKSSEDSDKLYKGANVVITNAKRQQEAISIYTGTILSIYKDLVIMARNAYITAASAKGFGGDVDQDGTPIGESTLIRAELDVNRNTINEYFEGIYA